jgi:hypothetical protein
LITSLRTLSEIFSAGVAITALSVLIYALTFNLKDGIARSFVLLMGCMAVIYGAESLGSAANNAWLIERWLRVQWVGIIMLPASFYSFSQAILETTGVIKRKWLSPAFYGISLFFLFLLPANYFVNGLVIGQEPASYLSPTIVTQVFTIYYALIMVLCWLRFLKAFFRSRTATSRRRMGYIVVSVLGPSLGSFPYLLFGSQFAERHLLLFWSLAAFFNGIVVFSIVLMAYTVAFYGVGWPDRVVKSRLMKWLLRGPATAIVTLAVSTIVRRFGEVAFGQPYSGFVPAATVATILICEYTITLLSPLWERLLFYSNDTKDIQLLRSLEDRMISRSDLQQLLEMVLSAVVDRLQVPGAYLADVHDRNFQTIVTVGDTGFEKKGISDQMLNLVTDASSGTEIFEWEGDYLIPLFSEDENQVNGPVMIGLLGISEVRDRKLTDEQLQALDILIDRATMALRDRRIQNQIFQSLQSLDMEFDVIQQLRAAGRYEKNVMSQSSLDLPEKDFQQWVKEALSHYWGGPKLTESPLLGLSVVKAAEDENGGSSANALRAILKKAIENTRPEGERRFTTEWILYNILEMKFVQGKKVREIAERLALSEADLYRKQRIAIESVAKVIMEMEADARSETQ